MFFFLVKNMFVLAQKKSHLMLKLAHIVQRNFQVSIR